MENILKKFPDINVFIEDHKIPEITWKDHWDRYSISLIIMGGDHFDNLKYLNEVITPNGNKMKIIFLKELQILVLRTLEI